MTIPRRRVVGLVAVVLVIASCGRAPEPSPPPVASTGETATAEAPSAVVAPPRAGLVPSRVAVPAMGLDEPLIDLGLAADNTMEVPTDYDDVGWFTGGGRPGGSGSGTVVGPTVLAGHVDSTTGPAVFFRLDDVRQGDEVTVSTTDGTNAVYRVTEIGDYAKADFPTARVFGAVPRDEVRLITCAGVFDDAAGSYERNLVVFGTRIA